MTGCVTTGQAECIINDSSRDGHLYWVVQQSLEEKPEVYRYRCCVGLVGVPTERKLQVLAAFQSKHSSVMMLGKQMADGILVGPSKSMDTTLTAVGSETQTHENLCSGADSCREIRVQRS